MPIAVGAGQAAHLQAEDQADVVEGDLGQESLEAGPPLDRLAAPAQVLVDGRDPVACPAEGDGAVGQGILPGGGLLMVADLLRRGLADVDEGRAIEVPGPELGRTEWVIHGRPPRREWPPGALPGAGRAGPGAAVAAPPGGGPRRSAWSSAGRERSSGAGGDDASSGGRHGVSPGVSIRCRRHNAASSSNAATSIVTGAGGLAPPVT